LKLINLIVPSLKDMGIQVDVILTRCLEIFMGMVFLPRMMDEKIVVVEKDEMRKSPDY